MSGSDAVDPGEIDLRAQRLVDVVGEGVERDMRDNLQDLVVAVAGRPNLLDLGRGDAAACRGQGAGKGHRSSCLGIVGRAFPGGGDFRFVQFRELRASEAVRGESDDRAS